jgi:hypothetical protein
VVTFSQTGWAVIFGSLDYICVIPPSNLPVSFAVYHETEVTLVSLSDMVISKFYRCPSACKIGVGRRVSTRSDKPIRLHPLSVRQSVLWSDSVIGRGGGLPVMHVHISLSYISLRAHISCYSQRAAYSTVCYFICICASSTHSIVFVKNFLSLCSALSRFGRLLMSHIMES